MRRLWAVPLFFAGALLLAAPAIAQSAPGQGAATQTPAQIQALIAGGQPGQAVAALDDVLAVHPKSGVAWYLLAEAYDAQGDEADAGSALNMAARSSPGLPFANKPQLAAMQARIAGSQPHAGNGGHTAMLVIGGLILLVVLLRFLPGRGVAARNYGYTQPPPPPGTPPYGFGYGTPQGGGGIGSALMGGLAAGAGFAAGERIIDGMMDQNAGLPAGGNDAARDDGLIGNPGWDDGSSNSGSDDLSNTDWS